MKDNKLELALRELEKKTHTEILNALIKHYGVEVEE